MRLDDMNRPNQTYVQFLRSNRAHAAIINIDTNPAMDINGVLKVFTGHDLQLADIGSTSCGWPSIKYNGTIKEPSRPILAQDKVCYVGQPIAAVIGETPELAHAGVNALLVELEDLPAVSDFELALEDANSIHSDVAQNICFDSIIGDQHAIHEVFEKADRCINLDIAGNRLIPSLMQPRACLGDYCIDQKKYTLMTTNKNAYMIRFLIDNNVLYIGKNHSDVVEFDVAKTCSEFSYHYTEEAFVSWASSQINRPVKWIASHLENLLLSQSVNDHFSTIELATDKSGRFVGLRVNALVNMGAYLSLCAPFPPTWLHKALLSGAYQIPTIFSRVRGIFTNTPPIDINQNAFCYDVTYLLERIINKASDELGIDSITIRKLNFMPPQNLPHRHLNKFKNDEIDYSKLLDQVVEIADMDGFDARAHQSQTFGKLRGCAVVAYLGASTIAPLSLADALKVHTDLCEIARIKVNPTGSVDVAIKSYNLHLDHQSMLVQTIAERLYIKAHDINILAGEGPCISDISQDQYPFFSMHHTYLLDAFHLAITQALDRLIEKGAAIAANMLNTTTDDIVFENALFQTKSNTNSKSFEEVISAAYTSYQDILQSTFEETCFYDLACIRFVAGAYICEIELDPETGAVRVDRFASASAFTNTKNTENANKQTSANIAQGIQQTLQAHPSDISSSGSYSGIHAIEWVHQKSILSKTLYQLVQANNPIQANDMPHCVFADQSTSPSSAILDDSTQYNPHNAIGVHPTIANGVIDALKPYGISHLNIPCTPVQIWQAIISQHANNAS